MFKLSSVRLGQARFIFRFRFRFRLGYARLC